MKKKKKGNKKKKSNSGPDYSEQSIGDDTKQCDSPLIFISPFLNCWLGERHSQMMVFTKVIIMKINQGLDSFFHCQLNGKTAIEKKKSKLLDFVNGVY